MIWTRVFWKGVKVRSTPLAMSMPYNRKFSSPPLSCTYITMLLSGDQNDCRIGRSFEAVSGFAAARSATGATQIFMTPSRGASHESHSPFGESEAPERLGLPKSLVRSISGAAAAAALATEAVEYSEVLTRTPTSKD